MEESTFSLHQLDDHLAAVQQEIARKRRVRRGERRLANGVVITLAVINGKLTTEGR